MQNVQKQQNNTSGFKGVWFHKRVKRWRAQIEKDGKRIYLGYFDSPEAAYAAYCKAASELFGEHACFE